MTVWYYMTYVAGVFSISLALYFFIKYISNSTICMTYLNNQGTKVVIWCIQQYTWLKDKYNTRIKPLFPMLQTNNNAPVYLCFDTQSADIHELQRNSRLLDAMNTRIFKRTTVESEHNIIYQQITIQQYRNPHNNDLARCVCVTKPFIQVEIHYNAHILDISQHLKKFYVVGNVMDGPFFKFFMNYFYGIDMSNYAYTIHYMDANIYMDTFDKNVNIIITQNGFDERTECEPINEILYNFSETDELLINHT